MSVVTDDRPSLATSDIDQWYKRANCQGRTDVFFPLKYSIRAVAQARTYCDDCPVFDACRHYATTNYPDITEGIFFGVDPAERAGLYSGEMRWRDWRSCNPLSRRQLAAHEREAIKDGVPAVLGLYRFFATTSINEKRAILSDYARWRAEIEHDYAGLAEARLRAQQLDDALARRAIPIKRRRRPVVSCRPRPELRPRCEKGCGPVWMYRAIAHGSAHQGALWRCYNCGTEIRKLSVAS